MHLISFYSSWFLHYIVLLYCINCCVVVFSRQQAQLPLSSAGVVYPGALSLAGLPSPQMPSEHSSLSSSPEHAAPPLQTPYHPSLKGDETRVKQEELRLDDSNGDAYDDFDYEDEEGDYGSDNDNHQ